MALVYLCGFQYQEESTGYSITSGPSQKLEPILALVYIQKSHFKILDDELWKAGMRLNQSPPQVFVSRTRRGGIEVRSTLEQTNMSEEEIQGIIRGFGIVSATVTLRTDVTDDHIVDTLMAMPHAYAWCEQTFLDKIHSNSDKWA